MSGPATESLPVTVCEWSRNQREVIRVRLDTYNGRAIVDVRCWYTAADGELRPSKSGLTLGTHHLTKLAGAVAEALVTAKRVGLIPENGGKP